MEFVDANALKAFYTLASAATILANLAINSASETVTDLACGEGVLLATAFKRKKDLLQAQSTNFSPKTLQEFLRQDLTGIDILPSAVQTATKNLSALILPSKSESTRFAAADSTKLMPDTIVRGAKSEEFQIKKADVVLLNPPFLRHERLTTQQKKTLKQRFNAYEKYFDGKLGLHGYFVFLADRFTKDNGCIGFVLPASILRAKSTEGIRKFLIELYTIEHIILGCERASFSQRAQFREVLIIATKSKPASNSPCCISLIKKMPSLAEQAASLSQTIRNFSSSEALSYSDERLVSEKVSQERLNESISNLYSLALSCDSILPAIFAEINRKASGKLISFNDFLKRNKSRIVRFDYSPSFRGTFFVQQFRASMKLKRNINEWLIASKTDHTITLMNQLTDHTLTVPTKVLARGLRRFWKTDKLDISESSDFIVVDDFPGINNIVKDPSKLQKWKRYVEQRQAKLIVARRYDVTAPNTTLLAVYSEKEIVGAFSWSIQGLSDEEAKIAALWFNSSIFLISSLINRTETGGGWLRVDKSTLLQMPIIDIKNLQEQERKALLDLFESIKENSFPSILKQFQNGFPPRKRIDLLFLQLIGYSKEEADGILERVYPSVYLEIKKLRQLMYQ